MPSVLPLEDQDTDLSNRENLSDLVYARLREEVMSGTGPGSLFRPIACFRLDDALDEEPVRAISQGRTAA